MEENQEFISLKDIFLKIGEYFHYVRSKFIWMAIFGFLIGGYMAYDNYTHPVSYSESLTFMMDESKSGDVSIPGLDALGSLFGNKTKDNNLGKILQLFESRRIIHQTLFDTVQINGKNDVIANHYLDLYTVPYLVESYELFGGLLYKRQWPKRVLKDPDFRFSNSDVDNFKPLENLYLRLIYDHINGESGLGIPQQLSSQLDEETGIMKLSMTSEHEDITFAVLNNIYSQLSDFFIQKTVEKETKTYNLMRAKRDSVFTALTSAEYSLADFKDRNRNLVTVKGYLNQIQLERKASILSSMYRTVVGQMDATEFALKNKTPLVQVIDLPRRPITPAQPSWFMGLVNGGLIGGTLVIFFFLIRKLFKDIMA